MDLLVTPEERVNEGKKARKAKAVHPDLGAKVDSKEKVEIRGWKDLREQKEIQVFEAAKEGRVNRASKVTKVTLELVDSQDQRDLLVYLE